MDWTLEVVILPVSDIERSVTFYRDQVGFEDLLYRDKKWEGHEGVVKAAQTLVDFEKQGWIPEDNQTGTYDVASDLQNGKLGMWGNGTWAVAEIRRSAYDQRSRPLAFSPA